MDTVIGLSGQLGCRFDCGVTTRMRRFLFPKRRLACW